MATGAAETLSTQTTPRSQRARVARALWVLVGLVWAIAVLGWPLLALAQRLLTPDVHGSAIGTPPTLADVGFLVFIISVPAAVGLTGLALISGKTAAISSTGAAFQTVGLVAAVLALSFASFMAAQIAGFFFLSAFMAAAFGLN